MAATSKKRTVQEMHVINTVKLQGNFLGVTLLTALCAGTGTAASIYGYPEQSFWLLGAAMLGLMCMVPLIVAATARIIEYDRLISEIELTGATSMLNLKLDKFYSKLYHTPGRREVLIKGFSSLKHPAENTRELVETTYHNRASTLAMLPRFSTQYWKAVFSPAAFR